MRPFFEEKNRNFMLKLEIAAQHDTTARDSNVGGWELKTFFVVWWLLNPDLKLNDISLKKDGG